MSSGKPDGGCLAWTIVASSFMVSFLQDGFRFFNMSHLREFLSVALSCMLRMFHKISTALLFSECCIFQRLLWPPAAQHRRSFQSWPRRGSAHLLLHDSSHPWIRYYCAMKSLSFKHFNFWSSLLLQPFEGLHCISFIYHHHLSVVDFFIKLVNLRTTGCSLVNL